MRFTVCCAVLGACRGYALGKPGATPLAADIDGDRDNWEEALRLLRHMERDRVRADSAFYSATMDTCSRGSAWAHALGFLETMAFRHADLNVEAYNAALRTSEVIGAWPEAMELQRTMSSCLIEADTSTFSASIKTCEDSCEWERSIALFALFRHVARTRVKMDTIMFNAAMSCSVRASAWIKAWRMLRSMARRSVQADKETYVTTMTGVMEGGGWQWALPCLEMMREGGMTLPERTRSTLRLLSGGAVL